MEFEVLAVFLVVLFAHTSISEIFDLTADEIFKTVIGRDFDEYKHKLNTPKTYKELRKLEKPVLTKIKADAEKIKVLNGTHVRMRVLKKEEPMSTTTTRRPAPSTTIPSNVTVDLLKTRMRQIALNQLLETHESPMPDFKNGSDDPGRETRRFKAIVREVRRAFKPSLRDEELTQYYFAKENKTRLFWEKSKALALMQQFVYAARYKLPYVQLLRRKYRSLLKYRIGYCFALLRLLRQQQMQIFSSLDLYYKEFTNLMIHLRMYEKVVRIDVDIKDVCEYIRKLNYEAKLDAKPDYYDDDPEPTRMPGAYGPKDRKKATTSGSGPPGGDPATTTPQP